MSLIQTAAPAIEPITLAEAKAHLRLGTADEDPLILSLIVTSRMHIETALGLALITQSWSQFRDAWPRSRTIALPLGPIQSLSAIRIYADGLTYATLPASTFVLDGATLAPRLVCAATTVLPIPGRAANGIEIAFVAGYGATAASVPAPIRQALLLLVAHWYEHREPVEVGQPQTRIPDMISELLAPYRPVRL